MNNAIPLINAVSASMFGLRLDDIKPRKWYQIAPIMIRRDGEPRWYHDTKTYPTFHTRVEAESWMSSCPYANDVEITRTHLVGAECAMFFVPISLEQVQEWAKEHGIKSYIGHPDTALLLTRLLGIEVEANREMFVVSQDVSHPFAVLARYDGPRLPTGTTELPEGATFLFYEVTFTEQFMN